MSPKKIAMTTASAEEAPMSTTPTEPAFPTDAEHDQNMLESSLGTAEMTDAETIETLVRTDEKHLTEGEPLDPRDVDPETYVTDDGKEVSLLSFDPQRDLNEDRSLEGKDGTKVARTQGTLGMFHVLSQIGDGVFVAWDYCRNGRAHRVADCNCKGGPKEPDYVTKWREEWIAKRDKEMSKAIKNLKKDAQRDVAALIDGPTSTVDDGLQAATEAVAAASEEETP